MNTDEVLYRHILEIVSHAPLARPSLPPASIVRRVHLQ